MPEGPLGGPRPFADDETEVLADLRLNDPVNNDEYRNVPPGTEELTEVMIEEMLANAGISRARVFIGRESAAVGGFRAIVTYGDVALSVPDAKQIMEDMRGSLDEYYDPIISRLTSFPAPFTITWKCSTVPSLMSGEDIENRIERSAKAAMDRLNSGVKGPSGGPRPFANPEGIAVEYRLNISGGVVDTQQIKNDIVNADIDADLNILKRKLKVVTAENLPEDIRLIYDEGSSGLKSFDLTLLNREMPQRIAAARGVELSSSRLTCGAGR